MRKNIFELYVMRIEIKNLGKIKEANIDLSKNLIVFFGHNNTGKTFVSYAIYNFLNYYKHIELDEVILNSIIEKYKIDFTDFQDGKTFEIDIVKIMSDYFDEIKKQFISSLKSTLSQTFGIYDKMTFADTVFEFPFLKTKSKFIEFIKNKNVNFGLMFDKLSFIIQSNSENQVIIKVDNRSTIFLNADQKVGYVRKVFANIISYQLNTFIGCYFISAERIGISLFGNELILNRFENTAVPNENKKFVNYPKNIIENISNDFRLRTLQSKSDEQFANLANEVEKNIIKGKIEANQEGIFFNENSSNYSIINSASNIKSLASLINYLRYFAKPNQVLFFDEPEINLHPENQLLVAKLLAQISNMGVKVIVSTHSDYIIREFNNLIMLGSSEQDNAELLAKYNYSKDEILKNENVGAYHFNDGKVHEVEITDEGMFAESIDEVIKKQNEVYNEIKWTLIEE